MLLSEIMKHLVRGGVHMYRGLDLTRKLHG